MSEPKFKSQDRVAFQHSHIHPSPSMATVLSCRWSSTDREYVYSIALDPPHSPAPTEASEDMLRPATDKDEQWYLGYVAKLKKDMHAASIAGMAEKAAEKAIDKHTEAQRRKNQPVTTGVLDYFPDAIKAVAECSRIGNEQHNPGQPLHWSREKSSDHVDCITRHLMERGTVDTDGVLHSAKVAWRALAMLQLEIEASRMRAQQSKAGSA